MTKTITRKQAQEIIDRLADKSLKLGQLVRWDNMWHTFDLTVPNLTSQYFIILAEHPECDGTYRIMHTTSHKVFDEYFDGNYFHDIKGFPIKLGDVMLKGFDKMLGYYRGLSDDGDTKIIDLWGRCGLNESLQDILEGAEEIKEEIWHCTHPDGEEHVNGCMERIYTLKSPVANLFIYLSEVL